MDSILYIVSWVWSYEQVSCNYRGNIKKTNYKIYIISGKIQNDFARIYLYNYSDRLLFRKVITDIGLVNFHNGLKVDKAKLEERLVDTF